MRVYAFSVLLVNTLAAIVTSSAAVTDGVVRARLTPKQQDLKYRQIDAETYEMLIDADEERRIVELLGTEYLDVELVATKVTGPPQHCPVCGKTTEFVDWVFTALSRGIHSPEFIVESLKVGNSPKKLAHDVYCSRCGHLTNFRDATGEEGGAPYLALAPPYDKVSRTFVKTMLGERSNHDGPIPAYWFAGSSWIQKRDDFQDDAEPEGLAEDSPRGAADRVADPTLGPPGTWHYPWQRKRDATTPSEASLARWLLERNDRETAGLDADSLHPTDEGPASSSSQGWAPLAAWWEVKRD
ncbi:hypothetical protein ONZ51_g1820 [Trametes cubensis]|uniref:Uncharacterized protein n=1 Tax=Trametes cubensis TaxID=1111947 RepID=A0AAD7U322_9APHY|nr:hypothetical protein ONZ51_g1820 [Trametes cubensis]